MRRESHCETLVLSGKLCRFSLLVCELRVEAEESVALIYHTYLWRQHHAQRRLLQEDLCGLGALV